MKDQKSSQAGRIALTVVLAILLLFSALATVLAAELRWVTRKETLATVITQIAEEPSGLAGEIMDSLCDYAAEEINSRLDTQIASQEVRELLAQSTLPEFLAEKVSQTLSGEPAPVTQEEVQTLLEDNRALLEGALGQPLSEEMEQQILAWAAKNADDLVDSIQSGLTHSPAAKPVAPMPAAMLAPAAFSVSSAFGTDSVMMLLIGAALCLVWTALLLAVNRRFLATGLCVSGSMYLATGILCALVLLVAATQIGIPVRPMLPPVLVVLGLALVLLISGAVLGVLKKKKEKAVA